MKKSILSIIVLILCCVSFLLPAACSRNTDSTSADASPSISGTLPDTPKTYDTGSDDLSHLTTPKPAYSPEPAEPSDDYVEEDTPSESPAEVQYIGNSRSGKFHYPWCSYLPEPQNQVMLYSYEEAMDGGFVPCKKCNP